MKAVGIAGGVALYAGAVVLAVAGFRPILPFVVVPPVLVLLIAGGSALGGRDHGRGRGAVRTGGVPLSSSGPNAPRSGHEPGTSDAAGKSEEAGTSEAAGRGGAGPG